MAKQDKLTFETPSSFELIEIDYSNQTDWLTIFLLSLRSHPEIKLWLTAEMNFK